MTSFINVRVGRLPGRIVEVALNGDRTVAAALATAGLDATGFDARVQGRPADMATTLSEGDIVLLLKKVKGNGCDGGFEGVTFVRVGRVPGPPLAEVAVEEPTVLAALAAAGITLGSNEVVCVNDGLSSVGAPIDDGDAIVVKARPAAVTTPTPPPASTPTPAADIAAITGTDPVALRAEAEEYHRKADVLEAEAAEAGRAARELRVKAEAAVAKAATIEEAQAEFDKARKRLVELGVIRPEGEGMMTDALRLFGLRRR
jgi:hypothetical protein